MVPRCPPFPSHRTAPVVLALVGMALGGGEVLGQSGCQFGSGTRDLQTTTIADGSQILRVGSPHLVCADGIEIWADSAVAYTGSSFSHFMGNVRFSDPIKYLTADTARYFTRQGRLQAHGHVVVLDSVSGAEIRGQDLVYLLKNDIRDEETMDISGGRSEAILFMRTVREADTAATADTPGALSDRAGALPDTLGGSPASGAGPATADTVAGDTIQVPYHVVADRIFLRGDRYFRGMGDVEIERDSLLAFGDTAEYDQVAGRILLRLDARVESDSYQIMAPRIDVLIPRGDIEEMRARDDATLLGQDLRLDAPVILLFMKDGEMNRLVALPAPEPDSAVAEADSAEWVRPVAVAEAFRLVADSIEAVAPGGVLDHLFAVGAARGESSARDSLNTRDLPEVARTDWLEGDTIVARFTQIPAADSAADPDAMQYRLEELVARVGARSLYRMLPSDSTSRPGVDPPAVHYVMGDAITITLKEGQVDRMEVEGHTRGIQLEPLGAAADTADSPTAPPDTTARPDTAAAGPVPGARPAVPARTSGVGWEALTPSDPAASGHGWLAHERRRRSRPRGGLR